jgi:hypothetical protein
MEHSMALKYKADFFLFDRETVAIKAASHALTSHVSAGAAVCEGSLSHLHPDDVNLNSKLLQ